jgi:uncharacterized protein (TIGR03435 family)
MNSDAGRVTYTGVSLMDVLMRAYDVNSDRITGPSWLGTERYDILAKLPDGVSKEQIPAMLQTLLAERFRMTVHRETKEQSVYALVVGKDGPKLKKSDAGAPASGVPAQSKHVFVTSVTGPDGILRLVAKSVTMSSFSNVLSNMVSRLVVDMTEIQGDYDISLEMGANEMVGTTTVVAGAGTADGAATPVRSSASSAVVFTAIQQIGLKLEPRKAPVEYLVVDKAEKVPTKN